MRSCAEVLRLLAQRPAFGAEEKDMVAFLVFCLRGIASTIEESAQAWDDRNYWKKAEGLRERWRWARVAAKRLERFVERDSWDRVPGFLVTLIPHFAGISITTITRDADWWCGAHRALQRQIQKRQAV